MEFTCNINMDNAVFDENPSLELERILNKVALAVSSGHADGPVYDLNGNNVGTWIIEL